MHEAAYKVLGLSHHYRAIRVPGGELAVAVRHLATLGYRGLNLTLPLKEEALSLHSFEIDPIARQFGAVNTLDLVRQTAINTDVPGFLATLPFKDSISCLVLGAGGTAKALAIGLRQAGHAVHMWNRTASKLSDWPGLEDFGITQTLEPDSENTQLVVNATSTGLAGADLPVIWSETGGLAYDVVYATEPTPFLQSATAAGWSTLDGKAMLVEQGALALEYWLGVVAPREAMMKAVL